MENIVHHANNLLDVTDSLLRNGIEFYPIKEVSVLSAKNKFNLYTKQGVDVRRAKQWLTTTISLYRSEGYYVDDVTLDLENLKIVFQDWPVLSHTFQVKPMSANRMFGRKGRTTFKTAEYLDFQNEIRDELMGTSWPFGDSRVSFYVEAQFSNRGADLDNMIKPLLDTFQSIYGEFNDKEVYHIELEKRLGKRGAEYISVRIEPYIEQEVEAAKQETKEESKP